MEDWSEQQPVRFLKISYDVGFLCGYLWLFVNTGILRRIHKRYSYIVLDVSKQSGCDGGDVGKSRQKKRFGLVTSTRTLKDVNGI